MLLIRIGHTRRIAAHPDTAAPNIRSVLVPLDGSSLAADAVPTAQALARHFGADLYAIKVVGSDDDRDEALREVADSVSTYGIAPGHLSVVTGDDVVRIIERRADELEAPIICISSHGRGRVAGAVAGSTTRALLRGAGRPLIAVGPMLAEDPRDAHGRSFAPLAVPRLVACVDGSPESEVVLPVAAGWAKALHMSLHILTVAEPVPESVTPGAAATRRVGPDGDVEGYVADLVAKWSGSAPDVTGSVHWDPVSAGAGIDNHLRQHPAGLLAVSTHAREGIQRVVHGAEAANIVHQSPVPVLMVPQLTSS